MNDIKELLSKQKIFQSYPLEKLEKISECCKTRTIDQGAFLIHEGKLEETFFLILEGQMQILKEDTSVGMAGQGDILGESVFQKSQRSASVRALKKATLIEFSLPCLSRVLNAHELADLKDQIFEQLFKKLTEANSAAIFSVRQRIHDQEERSLMGDFIIYVLSLILLYVFILQSLTVFKLKIVSSTIVSIPVLVVFGTAMILMMRRSRYSLKVFGFTRKRGWSSFIQSLLFTVPILGGLTGLKWILIQTVPIFSSFPLFHVSAALNDVSGPTGPMTAIVLIVGYCLFVPVQEIIYRGAMQSSLQIFFKGRHKIAMAIFVSNIPFAMIHFHLSLILTVVVYFFGLFWGWMYALQRNLIGCITSHMIIGFYAFFIIGIQDLFLF